MNFLQHGIDLGCMAMKIKSCYLNFGDVPMNYTFLFPRTLGAFEAFFVELPSFHEVFAATSAFHFTNRSRTCKSWSSSLTLAHSRLANNFDNFFWAKTWAQAAAPTARRHDAAGGLVAGGAPQVEHLAEPNGGSWDVQMDGEFARVEGILSLWCLWLKITFLYCFQVKLGFVDAFEAVFLPPITGMITSNLTNVFQMGWTEATNQTLLTSFPGFSVFLWHQRLNMFPLTGNFQPRDSWPDIGFLKALFSAFQFQFCIQFWPRFNLTASFAHILSVFSFTQEAWAVFQQEGLENLVDLRHAWANARDRRWGKLPLAKLVKDELMLLGLFPAFCKPSHKNQVKPGPPKKSTFKEYWSVNVCRSGC